MLTNDSTAMIQSLTEEIAQARTYIDHPPSNEGDTCTQIIVPLLWSMGYARREVASQQTDNNGQFPDYTILPGSEHTWYVEAKAWGVQLDDRSAQQALNYAFQNGRRWVVLTNGRVWRLYDGHIFGIAAQRLVVEVGLGDDSVLDLLKALSRESVISQQLEQYAVQQRLTKVLADQLRDPESQAITALVSVVRSLPGLTTVSEAELADWLTSRLKGVSALPRRPQPKVALEQKGAEGIAKSTAPGDDVSLPKVISMATGKRPAEVTFPGRPPIVVSTWADFAREVVAWVSEQKALPPVPFRGRQKGKCYFLNVSPEHSHEPMRNYRQVSVGDEAVFVDVARSATDLLSRLVDLMTSVDIPADVVTVRLALPAD